jgi:hypothetical protein
MIWGKTWCRINFSGWADGPVLGTTFAFYGPPGVGKNFFIPHRKVGEEK